MKKDILKIRCEALYAQYNHPDLIHPDPLEAVRPFPAKADREIAVLMAGIQYILQSHGSFRGLFYGA